MPAIYLLYLIVLLPLVAIGTCAACVAGIPVVYLVVLARVLAFRPAWLPDPKHWPHPPAESEPAVPHYFYGFSYGGLYGPAVADIVHAARLTYDACRTIWVYNAYAALTALARRQPRIAPLLRVAGAVGMGAGIVIGVFVAGCCAFVHAVMVGLSAVGWRCLATVLNGAGAAARRTQTCTGCSGQVQRPRYKCPGNGCRRHHDLRPGRFGVLRRRCHCGVSIRTAWLAGPPPAKPICPQCDRSLTQGSLNTAEILVPFFGATDTATNQQMLALIEQLRVWDLEGQLSAVPDTPGFAGETSAAPGCFPSSRHSHDVRLLTDDGTRVLRVFDATDAQGGSPDGIRTCVLVIDPGRPSMPSSGIPSSSGPSSSGSGYDLALGKIEATGLDSHDVRLAVVFTQEDLAGWPERKVVRWASRELGLGELVSAVRRDFKESRFFCASADNHGTAAGLLRWLLIADGVAPARSRVVVDVRQEEETSYCWHRRYVFAAMLAVIAAGLALWL